MTVPRKRPTRHNHASDWGPWADAHRWELGPEPGDDGIPDAPDDPRSPAPGEMYARLIRDGHVSAVPPVSGGAPTPADRADLEAWLDQVDADYPPADQPEDPMAFPPAAGPADRRRAAADVRDWFATHPGA
jgi:hypothetical protein